MKSANSLSPPVRSKRFHRSLALVAVLLAAVAIAVIADLTNRGANSARFAALREGMTLEEVTGVLKPDFVSNLAPRRGIDGLVREDLPADPSSCQIVGLVYSETPVLPSFLATVTFVQGRLAIKEIRKPSLREIFEHWWSQIGRS